MVRSGWIEKVEADLKSEVTLLGECDAQVQLGPYRSAFDKLLREFRSLKPLLVQIKSAYDSALDESSKEAAKVAPLQSLVATVAEDCERKMLKMGQDERDDLSAMRAENKRLKGDIRTAQSEIQDLNVQVSKLGEELGNTYRQYRDEKCARRLLISDMNDQKIIAEQAVDTKGQDPALDPVHMKLALEQCRKDLTEAQKQITKMKIEYAEVVPKQLHEQMATEYHQTQEQRDRLQKNLTRLRDEFTILRETYEQVSTERDEAVKVKDDLGRSGTPRPEWESVASQLEMPSISSTDLSSRDKVNTIIHDLSEARQASGVSYIQTMPPDGTSDADPVPVDFPRYLRSADHAEVRNRKLSPEETAKHVKELWKAKLTSGDKTRWDDFFPREMARRYAEARDEFVFSIHHALVQHQTQHPHFAKFLDFLSCKRLEEEYVRIVAHSSDLLNALQAADEEQDGIVAADKLYSILASTFPLKTTDALNALKGLFGGEAEIQYDNYFDETDTGAPSNLVKLLQEQDTAEKSEYIKQVKSQLEGTDEITTAEAKIAFMSIDPGITVETINAYLSVGLSCKESN